MADDYEVRESLFPDEEKRAWGDGPWVNEPDRVEWRYKGLPCLLKRGPLGNWCGYVGVPPEHPLHGQNEGRRPERARRHHLR